MIRCVSNWDSECVRVAQEFMQYMNQLHKELAGYIENGDLDRAFCLTSAYDDALVSLTTILAGHADEEKVKSLDKNKWVSYAEEQFQVRSGVLIKQMMGEESK